MSVRVAPAAERRARALSLPSPLLGADEGAFAESVRAFACRHLRGPGARQRDERGEFWAEGWARCAELGLCGLPAPPALGGSGATRVGVAAALEALGYGCDDAGLVFSISAHLWSAVVPLWQFGTHEQQARYLPRLCDGSLIGVHAMTEPASGSDAYGLRTVASAADGGYVLTGRKSFITNAPVAGLVIVFARLPGTSGALGVTAFLVEAGTPGLAIETPVDKMGLRTSPMAEVSLDGVIVGEDAVLGRPGRGARVFTTSMEWERTLIMAGALGAFERSLEETVEYSREREQFGVPIASFGSVADKIADARIGLAAGRALLYETAARYDLGEAGPAPAAIAKIFCSEMILGRSLDLLQVHGGSGFTRSLPFERRVRDAVAGRIYSGTSEVLRRVIGKDMGL